MRKLLSLLLALCLTCGISTFVSATEIDESGGAGTTPVSLTTTNGGIGDGNVVSTKLSVSIPTTLPVAMADNGAVISATDCKIVNWSYGAVRVASVSITAVNGWRLTAFGDKSTLAGEKVDSNKLGFALSIGDGRRVQTDSSNAATQRLITSPMAGCYLTGSGDVRGSVAAIDYAAIITPLSHSMRDVTVANVVIVVEWDT